MQNKSSKNNDDAVTTEFDLNDILEHEVSESDIEKYQKNDSKKDRVGLLGNWGVLIIAAVIGYTSVGALLATISGQATILGSTFLGGILQNFIVAETPIVFAIFGTLISALIAYVFIKFIRSGQHYDTKKEIRKRSRELEE